MFLLYSSLTCHALLITYFTDIFLIWEQNILQLSLHLY